MRKYIILTDSGCDLYQELRETYDIEYVCMHYSCDGQEYDVDLDWKQMPAKEFYDAMREGKRFITSQVNAAQYKAAFTKYAEAGYDVLYVGTSSEISAGIKASYVAREEVLEKYPDMKIICIDALRACFALGLLAIRASELRAEGKTIEEAAAWIEANKLTVNMIGSVDKLTYLKQAGRVSAASAFFGGLLHIKPIIIADALGRNFAYAKVKGRKNSLEKIAEMAKEVWEDVPYQRVMICHADCLDEAEILKQMLFTALGKEVKVDIGYVGSAVGSAVGPGMIGVFLFGKEVIVNKQ
ncbi:MAG: DegV family protein [Clostridiales bacterium]|nr:DegV family protein [Clostridiales bacterium]